MAAATLRRALLGALALCLVASGAAFADKPGNGAFKLEGAWIARVVGTNGQWTYVVSPDNSGRHATAHGSIDVGFATSAFGPVDSFSPLLVDVVVTGPKTAKFSSIWYGLRKLNASTYTHEIAYIGMNHGTLTSVGPGKVMGMHHLDYYLPIQDADGNGLPDPGQQPVASVEFQTDETRLPSP